MLTTVDFIATLEELSGADALRCFIEREIGSLDDDAARTIKARANELLSSDMPRSLDLAECLAYAGELAGRLVYQALASMVRANALRLSGDLRGSIVLYDLAEQQALSAGSPVEAARSQVGKIGALMHLGAYQAALELSQRTGPILLAHNEIISAAGTYYTSGCCYCELEQPQAALVEYSKAQSLLEPLDTPSGQQELAILLYNSALTFISLGRYQAALQASLQAVEIANKFHLVVDAARYRQREAHCYYLTGNYNKALRLLHQAESVLANRHLITFLIPCRQFILQCYLELGRYEEVVEGARALIALLAGRDEAATWNYIQAQHTLGRALAGLENYLQADQSLAIAQNIAERMGASGFWQRTALRRAEFYLASGRPEQVGAAEKLLLDLLDDLQDVTVRPTAYLLLARIAFGRGQLEKPAELIQAAIVDYERHGLRAGLWQAYYLRAQLDEARGDLKSAAAQLDRSLEGLEQLRASISSESRPVFLRSKERVYEMAVLVALRRNDRVKAFELVERVKSRALVELVESRLDIRVRLRDETDRPLVESLESLRVSHNDLTWRLARWFNGEDLPAQAQNTALLSQANRAQLGQEVAECERQISALTERLQVRNALYAEDISLAPVFQSFDPAYLQPDEVLLEYCVLNGKFTAFVVSCSGIQLVQSLCTVTELNRLLSFFRLNLAGTVKNLVEPAQDRQAGLLSNSLALLHKLYLALYAPLAESLAGYNKLRIVPYGSLHYLPFHALADASGHYLLESYEEISYLPAASLLRTTRERGRQVTGSGALVAGFSNGGLLPYVVEEARAVTATLQKRGECVEKIELEASLEQFRRHAPGKQLLHLATHGVYRPDAPLFSSLLLAGGELSGHELFNMELDASLFTLSSCDSGLGAPGGGDEVQGLSRACLYAGVASLALALWRVEDRSGSLLMQAFYANLLAGKGKAAALRLAQLDLLKQPAYQHPFYWASFVLIGDSAAL